MDIDKILAGNMVVSIQFLGLQRSVTETDAVEMSIGDGTKVSEALEHVRRKYPTLHLDNGDILITVNQEIASLEKTLKPGDAVSFIPFVGGG